MAAVPTPSMGDDAPAMDLFEGMHALAPLPEQLDDR